MKSAYYFYSAMLLLCTFAIAAALWLGAAPARAAGRELRVCADPNNLPFSNQAQAGFENRLADLIARELHATVQYTWWPQRRGFIRNTLNRNTCDVVMGVPAGYEMVSTTRPVYRSTYVFVYRKDSHLKIRSLNDPILRRLKIGVELIGDDYANTPPVEALARRGIKNNIHGYMVQGDYSQQNPPARILDAVVNKDVDVAIVWGPLAGYFIKQKHLPLITVPVSLQVDPPNLRFSFDISLGVRRGNRQLQAQLNDALEHAKPKIARLLEEYGFPVLPVSATAIAARR